MKPLYFGVGLLLALLLLCLGAGALLSEKSAETERWLLAAGDAAAAGDMARAREYARKAGTLWEESTPVVDALTSHEETDEIRRAFAELLAAEGRADFLTGCARLTAMTAHLRQMERACWYNILAAGPLFGKGLSVESWTCSAYNFRRACCKIKSDTPKQKERLQKESSRGKSEGGQGPPFAFNQKDFRQTAGNLARGRCKMHFATAPGGI